MAVFKKKSDHENYPEYWQKYLSTFNSKSRYDIPLSEGKYAVLDVESTGLDTVKDKILSIGAVKIYRNEIMVSNTFEVFIDQLDSEYNNADIHGILKEGKENKIPEEKAVYMFLNYIEDSILVGHGINFDISIINNTLKNLGCGKLVNRFFDTAAVYKRFKGTGFIEGRPLSLDDLSKEFSIPGNDRHTAPGDAMITAVLFMKLISRLKNRGVVKISDLMRSRNILF